LQHKEYFGYFIIVIFLNFIKIIKVHYLISPKIAHRFVSYLEEEAVRTYTHCLKDIDENLIPEFKDFVLN
jgi:hypothetical protein